MVSACGKSPSPNLVKTLINPTQLASLVGVEPEHSSTLYKYLISKPSFTTPSSRQALVRRLREALVKNVALQGVCKPLEALFSISKIERDEDKDYTFTRYLRLPFHPPVSTLTSTSR